MRFPAEKIKEAILSPDHDLRFAAVLNFARAGSQDLDVMPLVMQAVERYGAAEAFSFYHFWVRLPQTVESLRWILRQDENGIPVVARWELLLITPPALRNELAAEIKAVTWLDDEDRERLQDNAVLAARPVEELWRELKDVCQQIEAGRQADALAEADSELEIEQEDRDNRLFVRGDQILDALNFQTDPPPEKVIQALAANLVEPGVDRLLGEYAVELAGMWRLEQAVPRLSELLNQSSDSTDDEWLFEACYRAMNRIGTDAVVRQLATDYAQFKTEAHGAAAQILGGISSDESVRTALELFAKETDLHSRCWLLIGALGNFETTAIPVAREFILQNPLSPEVLEVRRDLLIACKLTGDRFPEYDAWMLDSANDDRLRKEWYDTHESESDADWEDDEFEDDEYDDEGFAESGFADEDFDGEESPKDFGGKKDWVPHPDTFVWKQPHVGRNDLCPCGSGKKFKKCCYGKRGE